ncbi:MAG: DUF4012 domain-containing protein [Actinomycetota bacterium]|nr:DUF4012 domain-containing protein [Actinomycetota bacterium]
MSLRILHWLPIVGEQRDGLVQLVDDVDHSIVVGRKLLQQVNALSNQAKISAGVLPIGILGQVAADAGDAGRQTSRLVRPAGSLWGPLGASRRQLNSLITKASSRLANVGAALDGAQRFIGAGDHHYFLALQNNAEMRDQGMVLSYAEVEFNNGTMQFGRHGSVDNIELKQPAPTPIPAGTASAFGYIHPTQTWQSVNPGADFAWSARAMSDMYQQVSGQATDGVIALDVPALAALLQVTGPVQVPGIAVPLTAANAATVLLHDLYVTFGPSAAAQEARHERLSEAANAVIDRLRQGNFDAIALATALGKQAAGAHLKLWSRDVSAERSFEQVGLAGGAGVTEADRTFHLALENRASNKLDYYVQVSMTQAVTLNPNGDAVVVSSVVVHNDAPVGAPASSQLGPDVYKTTEHPGDYLGWVLLWGPKDSSQPPDAPEGGLNLSQAIILVPAGESRTTHFVTVIHHAVRAGKITLRYVPQPRLTPESLAVSFQGLHTVARHWSGSLDHTQVLEWPAP